MTRRSKINCLKNDESFKARRFSTSSRMIGVALSFFCVCSIAIAQDFYGDMAYPIGPQIVDGFSSGEIYGFPGDIPGARFDGGAFPSYPLPVDGYTPFMEFQNGQLYPSQTLPQNFNGFFDGQVIPGANGQYRILGEVTGDIPIGNSQYDNIPILEDPQINAVPRLPELNVPINDSAFIDRVDALRGRFSKLPLSVQRSTPGRLLRYSLIGGAEQTFLAPRTSVTTTGTGETTSQSELQPIFALGALCWNYPCSNRRILREVDGRPIPAVGFGFQSQRGELLAALAFARIDRNYEIHVDGKTFTVQDLVEWEKYSCSSYANLSLVAVGLAHYSQDPDETWVNAQGETWSLAKILEQESQRPIDWETAEATNKLLAFTYLLGRLKMSAHAQTPELGEALKRTEEFLIAVKNRVWDLMGDKALSSSLFFNTSFELSTPYMTVYVNGKLLRWIVLVSSPEEMRGQRMKRAMFELCGLVDQLFNSVDDLDTLSAIDEETLAIAMQTLIMYRKSLATDEAQ